MAITLQEFEFRVNQLGHLDFEDATPRLIGFLEWLEQDEKAGAVLARLRAIDLNPILKDCGWQTPPKAKSPDEVAAIALYMIDRSKEQKTELIQAGMAIGVRGASSSFQDWQDEINRRYLIPFFEYMAMKLSAEGFEESSQSKPRSVAMNTKDIFIVHGRDEAAKQTVARVVEQVGLNPIILHEQPNKGRTIIEKFEDHAEVAFAIVLLTPDDAGLCVADDEKNLRPRPRQNVVFEMGYFIGRIGRQHVFPLKKGELDIPSDYNGVGYTPMDEKGAWKIELLRELKEAGFEIDYSKVLG
jgi:predicted nucleotide-binding protein